MYMQLFPYGVLKLAGFLHSKEVASFKKKQPQTYSRPFHGFSLKLHHGPARRDGAIAGN